MTFRIVSIGDCIFKLAFYVNHIKIRNVRGYFTNPWGHVWVENRTEFQSFPEDRKHAGLVPFRCPWRTYTYF